MAVHQRSRHTFTEGRYDSEGRAYLTARAPFTFRALDDNVSHRVVEGDTWWSLAGRYFQPLERPAGLWWVIPDFQPRRVVDPTTALVPGSTVLVPSVRTVLELVLGEARRQDFHG